MKYPEEIGDKEIILRRIPPSGNIESTQVRPEGGLRAVSIHLQIKKDETGLSCSRLLITSPKELLDQLEFSGIPKQAWMVCRIFASDIYDLGLDVVYCKTELDLGHCEIRPTPNQSYSKTIRSKLAKKTRILTEDEVDSLQAGDELRD